MNKVLTIKESDTYALKNKIYALESLNQYEQVIELCQVTCFLEIPMMFGCLNSMGLSLNELDRHQEALDFYEKSLRIDPDDVTALMNKAISLSHLKNYKDAITFYDKAQVIDPNLKEIPRAKSKLFEKLGMEDEAFLAAQGVLSRDMEKIKRRRKRKQIFCFSPVL